MYSILPYPRGYAIDASARLQKRPVWVFFFDLLIPESKLTGAIPFVILLGRQVTNSLTLISASCPDSPISALGIAETWLRLTNAKRPEEVQVVFAFCAGGGKSIVTRSVHLAATFLRFARKDSSQGLRFPPPVFSENSCGPPAVIKSPFRGFLFGAGGGNRTLIYCLEGSHFTTKLRPQMRKGMRIYSHPFSECSGRKLCLRPQVNLLGPQIYLLSFRMLRNIP